MSVEALNTLFNDDLNSGVMRIFYDFSTTGISSSPPTKQFPSLDNASQDYPALIFGYASGTSSSAAENASFNGGSGVKLYGGVYPNNYEQFLTVQSGSGVFTGQEFTMMFEAEKLCRVDFSLSGDGPIHDREIIFSNRIGSHPNVSGWELGLNSANLLYFKTWDLGQPKTLTLNTVPYGKNVWFFTYGQKNASLYWFDPAERTAEKSQMSLAEDLTNGGDWYIGSGNAINSINTGSASSKTSSLLLSAFGFFDQRFFEPYISTIATAWKSESVSATGVDGEFLFDISGVQEVCEDISGALYSSWVLDHTDYVTGYTTGTEPVYSELTGLVPDGSDYYVSEDNNGYITETNNSGGTITGVTGFGYTYPVTTGVTEVPVFVYQEVSGVVGEECQLTVTTSGQTGYTTGVELSVSGYDASDIFPDLLSYLGPRFELDYVEQITGVTSYSGTTQIVNVSPVVSESSYGLGKTIRLEDPELQLTSGSNVFLNGLSQRLGTGNYIEGYESGRQTFSLVLEKEFAIFSGNEREIANEYPFTGNDQMLNLWGVVDVGQEVSGRQSIQITDTGQYSQIYFTGIQPSGKQVFFNGQKIYENENYLNSGNYFIPTGFVTLCTGTYFSIPDFDGAQAFFGLVDSNPEYDYSGPKFYPKSVVYYLNGVREGYSQLLEHGSGKDLISGFGIEITGTELVFEG